MTAINLKSITLKKVAGWLTNTIASASLLAALYMLLLSTGTAIQVLLGNAYIGSRLFFDLNSWSSLLIVIFASSVGLGISYYCRIKINRWRGYVAPPPKPVWLYIIRAIGWLLLLFIATYIYVVAITLACEQHKVPSSVNFLCRI